VQLISADLKEMQSQNAECSVSQFLAIQKELRRRAEEGDLDKIAATLTAALFSSDVGAKACGITDNKQTPPGYP